MKNASGNEGERGDTGRMAAGEGALGLRTPVQRTRRARSVNHQPREAERKPAREGSRRDRRAATTMRPSQVTRDQERDGDVRAR